MPQTLVRGNPASLIVQIRNKKVNYGEFFECCPYKLLVIIRPMIAAFLFYGIPEHSHEITEDEHLMSLRMTLNDSNGIEGINPEKHFLICGMGDEDPDLFELKLSNQTKPVSFTKNFIIQQQFSYKQISEFNNKLSQVLMLFRMAKQKEEAGVVKE